LTGVPAVIFSAIRALSAYDTYLFLDFSIEARAIAKLCTSSWWRVPYVWSK